MSESRDYEVYVEVFEILSWKVDGTGTKCVYKTRPRGHEWISKTLADANRPAETQLIYAAASDEFAQNNMTIRVKKDERQ